MKLEEAIKTAIEFETKVQGLYQEAHDKASDAAGRKVFAVLRDEEQGHLDYLKHCLNKWQESGHLTPESLGTVIPPKEKIAATVQDLRERVSDKDYSAELDMLKKALSLELETGNFYKKMVAELDETGQKLFERFVVIEDGHYAIVQAQIDALDGMGFWFDSMEFSLEAG